MEKNYVTSILVSLLLLGFAPCAVAQEQPPSLEENTEDVASPELLKKYLSQIKGFTRDSISEDIFEFNLNGHRIDKNTPYFRGLWDCDCIDKNDIWYYGGHWVKRYNYYIVFLNRFCNDSYRNEFLAFNDLIIQTFAADGREIDHEYVGSRGIEHYTTINGLFHTGVMNVTCGHLIDKDQLYNREDTLYFSETNYEVTISDVGRIEKRMIGKPIIKNVDSATLHSRYIEKPALDFETFKSKFVKLDADTLTPTYFEDNSGRLIHGFNKNTYSRYIDKSLLCDCYPEGTSVYALYYIPQKEFDLFMLCADCDYPSRSTYLYGDDILVTTTKDGAPIASAVIARGGDIWEPYITFSAKPLSFSVKQLSDDSIPLSFGNRRYVISDRGVISEEPLE